MQVRAGEQQFVAIDTGPLVCGDIDHRERHPDRRRRLLQRQHVDRRIEAQQGVVPSEIVIGGTATAPPEMRGAASGDGRLLEPGHRIARLRLPVISDDVRFRIEIAEVQPPAAILLDVERIDLLPQRRARRLAFRPVQLHRSRHRAAMRDRAQRVVHREMRHLFGDRQPLRFISVEQPLPAPTVQRRGEQPRQVHRIGDARVHAEAGIGHPQMRAVAADEDAPVAEPVGDETAADPVLLADDLIVEIIANAEDRTDRGVAVDRVEILLMLVEVIMDQPRLAPVDRHRVARAARIERQVHPARTPLHHLQKARRADVGGLHALHHRVARQLRADDRAHPRSPAVATDQIARGERLGRAARQVAHGDGNAVRVLRRLDQLGLVADRDQRIGRRLREDQRLQIDLVDPVRRLRRRPPGVRPGEIRPALGARGDRDARDLMPPRHAGAIDAIVGIIRRQAGIANHVREAQPAERLHRARGDMVALHARRLAGLARLDDDRAHAAPREVQRHHQPDRAGAADDNLRIARHHCHATNAQDDPVPPSVR